MHGSVGRYAWGGAYGSTFWVDPKQRLVAVMMIQLIPCPGVTIGARFQTLVYSAIVRSGEAVSNAAKRLPPRTVGG